MVIWNYIIALKICFKKTFRLKDIDETRNYFLEEIKKNGLLIKNQKKVCTTLSYIEHFPI